MFAALIAAAWTGSLVLAAEPSVVPQPSPNVEQPAFLDLPAFDLELAAPVAVGPQGTVPEVRSGQIQARIGDQLELAPADAPPGSARLALPALGGLSLESLDDQGLRIALPSEPRVVAIPLKPGSQSLPSLEIQDASGKAIGRTNPVTIEVKSAISSSDAHPAEPVPPRPPAALRFPFWAVVSLAILALVLLAGMIYGLVSWSRRRRAALPPPPAAPPKPEHEIALEALERLGRSGLVEKGEFKRYYFGISDILKRYLGERYGFDAAESTTLELIEALESGKLVSKSQVDQLESFFERLDRVKFTDHIPDAGEPAHLLDAAKKMVLTTKKVSIVATQ